MTRLRLLLIGHPSLQHQDGTARLNWPEAVVIAAYLIASAEPQYYSAIEQQVEP